MRNDYRHLSLSRDGFVLTVSMSNPPLHTMVPTEVIELNTVMDDVESDAGLRVLVLTGGSEEFFVRSYDVGELADASAAQREGRGGRAAPPAAHPRARNFGGLMRRLENWRGITIAALNGNAAGGGFELALSCDFRLMRAGAFTVGLPETHVGIIPGAGGTQRLPRLIGIARALDLILHGARLSPEEALAAGLVHRVFPAGSYAADVTAFAANLAARAPLAIAAAKRAIRDGLAMTLDQGLAFESALFRDLMRTADASNALAAVAAGKPIPAMEGR